MVLHAEAGWHTGAPYLLLLLHRASECRSAVPAGTAVLGAEAEVPTDEVSHLLVRIAEAAERVRPKDSCSQEVQRLSADHSSTCRMAVEAGRAIRMMVLGHLCYFSPRTKFEKLQDDAALLKVKSSNHVQGRPQSQRRSLQIRMVRCPEA